MPALFLDLAAKPGPGGVKTADDIIAENSRLRDLVRRLAESLDIAADALWLANINGRMAITQPEPRSRHLHGVDIDALLREAREAVGEEAKDA